MIVISFTQLAYCVVQFLEKDASLTEPVSEWNKTSLLTTWLFTLDHRISFCGVSQSCHEKSFLSIHDLLFILAVQEILYHKNCVYKNRSGLEMIFVFSSAGNIGFIETVAQDV